MAHRFAGLYPVAGVRAECEPPADAVVLLRMADGRETSLPLRQVRARRVLAAVPWRNRHRAADAVLACDVRLCVVDDVHFLDPRRRDVANHFKYLANTFPVTFIFVGVGLERRGLVSEGLAAWEEELAQNARRWTMLGVDPFEIGTEDGRRTWRQLLLAIEKDLVPAGTRPGMVADDLADYLFARSGSCSASWPGAW
jgi:hypothetical protein